MDPPCLSDGLLREVFSTMDGQMYDQTSVQQNVEAPVEDQRQEYNETSCSTSRYTLDMIFNNLIYPDVNEGQGATYDTLLQTVCGNGSSDFLCSWLPQTKGGDSLSMTEAPEKRGTFSGKRKRSDHLSCVDDETQKRLRCKTLSNAVGKDVSDAATHDRRKLVPRRVGECRR